MRSTSLRRDNTQILKNHNLNHTSHHPTSLSIAHKALRPGHKIARGRGRKKQLETMTELEKMAENAAKMEKMRISARECRCVLTHTHVPPMHVLHSSSTIVHIDHSIPPITSMFLVSVHLASRSTHPSTTHPPSLVHGHIIHGLPCEADASGWHSPHVLDL